MGDHADQNIRTLYGAVLAGLRNDQVGYRALRPLLQSGDFISTAFGTLGHVAAIIAEKSGQTTEAVLREFVAVQTHPMARTVWEMTLAGEVGDDATFERLGERSADDPEFVPTVFGAVKGAAEMLGTTEGGMTAEQTLQALAMAAAMGEAGLGEESG